MGMFGNAFKPGGAGRDIAGYIGDALANIGGVKPVYGPSKMQERQQELEYQRQIALAQYKQQNPDPTGTMQNVVAAGFKPGTPEYYQFMQKAILAPRIMAVPGEGGTTEYRDFNQAGGEGGAAPAAPQLGAVQGGYVFLGGDPANEASWRKQ